MRRASVVSLLCCLAATTAPATRPATGPESDPAARELVAAVMAKPEWNGRTANAVVRRWHGAPAGLLPLLEPYWADAARDPDRAAMAYLLYLQTAGQEPPRAERVADVGHFSVTVSAGPAVTDEQFRAALKRQLPPGAVVASQLSRSRGRPAALLAVDGVRHHRQVLNALGDTQAPGDHVVLVTTADGLFTRDDYAAFLADRGKPVPTNYSAAFRALYDHLAVTYPEFELKRIDWPAVGRELLPQAEQVHTDAEFGLLVERLVARLKDSHAVVVAGSAAVPAPDLPQWDAGFTCLADDRDRPVVYAVQPDTSAGRAGVTPGTVVVAIDGVPGERRIAAQMARLAEWSGYSSDRSLRYDAVRTFACGSRGAPMRVDVVTPDGRAATLTLTADGPPRYRSRLPVPRAGVDDSADCSWTTLSDGTGYVYVRRIGRNLVADLDAAVRALAGCRGLILDVRGNSGGGFDADAAFANVDPDEKRWPDRPRFTGPIAMLVDERTISAGEGWASWFVARHRARLFGSTTAGASSRKAVYELPGGLFKVVVPVKPYTGFLDRPIEVRGLEPDEPVRCSAADLAGGRDTVVAAAVRWLATLPGATTRPSAGHDADRRWRRQ